MYYSDYYYYSSGPSTGAIIGMIVGAVIGLAFAIFMLVAMAKIFKKAGKPGWHVIIPFLNNYDEFDLAWGNGILFLLLLIPLVNVVISIMLMVKLAKAFGKDGGFAAGLIFLPIIFLPILGFGSAEYIGPDGAPRAMPGYGQPAYGQPAYQQPTYQQPQQPTYQQPTYQQPQQPTYQQPTYQQPTYQQPTYQQPQQPDQTGYNPPTNG